MEKDKRPWGEYEVIADCPLYKVKKITVKPGQRLSLQRHQHRQEHWYVVRGQALVTLGEQEILLKSGQAVDIPRHAVHRVKNPSDDLLEFIEVQTGTSFDENDIERLEDDYKRA